jgi:hypothetical protein
VRRSGIEQLATGTIRGGAALGVRDSVTGDPDPAVLAEPKIKIFSP